MPPSHSSRFRTTLAIGVACLAVIGLAACGNDDSAPEPSAAQAADIEAINEVADRMERAFDGVDSTTICGLLDPATIKRQFGNTTGCRQTIEQSMTTTAVAPSFDFKELTVDGDTAVGKTDSPSGDINFKKIGDKWYVTNPPSTDE